MSAFVTAGAGFLAVLWFDLMFDVQTLAHNRSHELPEHTLASIAAYYRRVTTAARPMNRLIALVMLATVAAVIVEIADGRQDAWVGWASLALAAAPIALAGAHTVPSAVRLGARRDTTARQSALARSILREHVFCWLAIAALLTLQLGFS